MTSLRYIHLEDSQYDVILIREILESHGYICDPIVVQTESELRANLLDNTIKLVIADYSLPRYDGLSALKLIRQLKPHMPVLIITGAMGDEVAVETLRQGATDYLLKDNLLRLPSAISRALKESNKQQELNLAQEQLQQHESFLNTITEYSQDAIISLDENGFIRLYNLSAERIFGWSKSDMMRSTMVRLFSKENLVQLQKQIDVLRQNYLHDTQPNHLIVLTAQKKSGEHFPVELSLSYAQGPRSKYVIAVIRDISERIKHEQEIIESRNFYESLIANFPVQVFRKNLEGKFVYANQHYCDFIGKSWEEINGTTVGDHFLPEYAEKYIQADQLVLQQNQSFEAIEEFAHQNGSIHYLHIIKTPIHDQDQNVTGIQGLCWDISKNKFQEDQIRLLSQIVESSPTSITVTDRNSQITYVNQSAIDRYQYDRDELIGNNPRIFKSGHYDEAFYQEMYNQLNAKKTFVTEMRNKTKSGQLLWDYSSYFPVTDEHGNVSHYVAISIDISDRKFFEQKLHESEQFAHAILDSLYTEIAIIDEQGVILHVNKPLIQFAIDHGIDNQFIGKNYFEIHRIPDHPDNSFARQAENGIKAVINGTQNKFQMEYPSQSPEEKEYWYLMRVSKMNHIDRNLYIIEHQNITNEKQLEYQLIQSNKLEAIGQLAGGVAHDFNNIILVIRGFSTLLHSQFETNSNEWEDLQEILKATDRAANLTRQLLAFSRNQVLTIKKINLNEVIQDMKIMMGRLIGEHIEVEYRHDGHTARFMGDHSQIEQVILNLCINARDAMPDGGKITIDSKAVEVKSEHALQHFNLHPASYVMLTIADTGHGIEEKIQNRIFDPFFTTKDAGHGTGLGLSTVYGIVKQCNGEIFVQSTVNKGTTFFIYFPIFKEIESEIIEPSPVSSAYPEPAKQANILVVEDDKATREIVYRLLLSMGHQVHWAANGEDALTFIQQHCRTLDLLLTDVIMPGMNGKELAQKALDICPDIQILFMSGYTENIIAQNEILTDEINFIHKPFELNELSQLIQKLLS